MVGLELSAAGVDGLIGLCLLAMAGSSKIESMIVYKIGKTVSIALIERNSAEIRNQDSTEIEHQIENGKISSA